MESTSRTHPNLLQSEQGKAMLSAKSYNAGDKTLAMVRAHTKQLCYAYNHCPPADNKLRRRLLKDLLPFAKGLWVEPNFFCDYGVNIITSKQVFINHNVTILDGAKVELGAHVLIGPNCVLATTSHCKDAQERKLGICISRPIILEKHVWLGANVTVLGGVTIGEGAIIGAGVTIKKDVDAYTIIN